MTTVLKVGDRIRDNDPRMGERILTIRNIKADAGYVWASAPMGSAFARIRIDRIHTDGKPRKSGFSLIASAGQ